MKPASLIDAALERLGAERSRIIEAIADADNVADMTRARLLGIEFAIAALKADAPAEPETPREKRQPPGAVERAIREMLQVDDSLGNERLQTAERIAEYTGQKPASVAAALRRMVATGAIDRDGELYRMHRAEQSEAAE